MRRLLFLAGIAILAVGLFISCGEDSATNPIAKKVGDTTDVAFTSTFDNLENVDDNDGVMLGKMDFLMDSVFSILPQGITPPRRSGRSGSFAAAGDSVMLTFHDSSMYWFLYASFDTIEGTPAAPESLAYVVKDSVQFLYATGPVQWPDSTLLTGLKQGAWLSVIANSGNLGSVIAGQVFDIDGNIAGRGLVTINGSNNVDGTFSDSGCTVTAKLNGTAKDVKIMLSSIENDTSSSCPQSGSMTQTGTIGVNCQGDTTFTYNDTWTVTMTFYGDSETIVAENATTSWTVTEPCGIGPAAKLFSWAR